MGRGRDLSDWDHTSHLKATMLNCRMFADRAVSPLELHPFRRAKPGKPLKVN